MRKSAGAQPEGLQQLNLRDSTIRLRQYRPRKGATDALHVLARPLSTWASKGVTVTTDRADWSFAVSNKFWDCLIEQFISLYISQATFFFCWVLKESSR